MRELIYRRLNHWIFGENFKFSQTIVIHNAFCRHRKKTIDEARILLSLHVNSTIVCAYETQSFTFARNTKLVGLTTSFPWWSTTIHCRLPSRTMYTLLAARHVISGRIYILMQRGYLAIKHETYFVIWYHEIET